MPTKQSCRPHPSYSLWQPDPHTGSSASCNCHASANTLCKYRAVHWARRVPPLLGADMPVSLAQSRCAANTGATVARKMKAINVALARFRSVPAWKGCSCCRYCR